MEVEMNRQDLLELYQLVVMYTRCYGLELGELLEEISQKYRKNTGGEDIRSFRNPKCAGGKEYMQRVENGSTASWFVRLAVLPFFFVRNRKQAD